MADKILWVVNYNDIDDFLVKARDVGATGVAIRTDNDISTAITKFSKVGISVYGWRWPSAMRDAAMKEAKTVVALLGEGLAGYFVDPEGAPGKPYDWNQNGLDQLADEFCTHIKAALGDKPFGVTSHYRAKAVFPKLPWGAFFKHATVLLPQAYWRSTAGTIGHGIPGDNYLKSIDFWQKAGGDRALVVPMAGELGSATASEVNAYVAAANKSQAASLHFYAYDSSISSGVWSAVSNA